MIITYNVYFLNTKYTQLDHTQELVNILRNKTQRQISKIMSLSDKLSKLNFDRFQAFKMPFSLDNSKQALLAFKGDVYNGINASSFSLQDLDFAQQNVRMLSGLYGVLRPLDLIQPYRLEMGTKLSNAQGNNLYDFWGSDISKILNEDEKKLIVNLASNEYFKAIDKKILKAQILDIVFKEKKKDTTNAEPLKDFSDEGYRFNGDLSSELSWVFLRG